jgi:hypothetical protein
MTWYTARTYERLTVSNIRHEGKETILSNPFTTTCVVHEMLTWQDRSHAEVPPPAPPPDFGSSFLSCASCFSYSRFRAAALCASRACLSCLSLSCLSLSSTRKNYGQHTMLYCSRQSDPKIKGRGFRLYAGIYLA